jgi:hypothetical protein
MPVYRGGHVCGHPFHHVTDYSAQSREMADLTCWYDWLHSQPCLSCSRPIGLIATKDPAVARLNRGALASLRRHIGQDAQIEYLPHSRFIHPISPAFENAGITPQQARVLEVLFLWPSRRAPYDDLAEQFDAHHRNTLGRTLTAMERRGMVRCVSTGYSSHVVLDRAAWRLRLSFSAWDRWLTAEGRQP